MIGTIKSGGDTVLRARVRVNRATTTLIASRGKLKTGCRTVENFYRPRVPKSMENPQLIVSIRYFSIGTPFAYLKGSSGCLWQPKIANLDHLRVIK